MKIKKSLSGVVCIVGLFSFLLTGCGQNETNTTILAEQQIHDKVAQETERVQKLVDEGKIEVSDISSNGNYFDTKNTSKGDIENFVKKIVSGNNLQGEDKLKKVNIVKQVNGGWGVFIEINADQRLSNKNTLEAIKIQMADIYHELFTSDYDIETSYISAFLPDNNGNKIVVYKTAISKEKAKTVDWENTKYFNQMEKIWDVQLINKSFKDI